MHVGMVGGTGRHRRRRQRGGDRIREGSHRVRRPIGSFQAIKHRLVDQRSAIEVGRALVNRAADACDRTTPTPTALVSLAAFWAIDSLRAVPEGATQVFGGIAYTWEHEAHVHLRRAATVAAALGPRAEHRQAITDWLATRG